MSTIRIGTCSWTDPTLVESDRFYPRLKMSAEERLRFYAGRFDTVEVDSTFYALPSEKVVGLQTTRTPDDFVLHYKAFGLLTQHSIDPRRLPKVVKGLLGGELAARSRLHPRDVPEEATDMAFKMFASALMPAHSAGKLGVVLFQFPPYFTSSQRNRDYILEVKQRLDQYQLAIEFRHSSWVSEENRTATFNFLEEHSLAYVSVDEPQFPSGVTLPPIAQGTAGVSYVRLHGRNAENWFKKGITVAERFAYDYSDNELRAWLPKIQDLASGSKETYVMFNNCYGDYGVRNAARLGELLPRE